MLNYFFAALLLVLGLFPALGPSEVISMRLKDEIVKPQREETEIVVPTVPERLPSFESYSSFSEAALFVDAASGETLYEKSKDKKLPMASTTKVMTALVTVENTNPNDVVTVPPLKVLPLDTLMGVSTGDKLTVKELLHGLLLESGADAAQALAAHVAGSEPKFVALMNERAAKLGLNNTQFTNSIGHDDNGHYSTAEDLVKLARVALTNPQIASIVSKKSYTATTVAGKKYYLSNTNLLLNENYLGLKTGTTFEAGQCLLTYYKEGDREIIGVVLDSVDRFSDTAGIIEWTKRAYTW